MTAKTRLRIADREGVRRLIPFTAHELHDLKVLANSASHNPNGVEAATQHSRLPWFDDSCGGQSRTHDIRHLLLKIEEL